MRINACLAFVACALRYIPCLVSAEFRRENQWMLLLLHAAQIINGSAGPVSSQPRLPVLCAARSLVCIHLTC